jgi:mannosyl-3-phosphoglycerate phosphatase
MAPTKKKSRPVKPGLIVFTDLDGTLLDFHTYSYDAAQAALRELKRLNVPLVLVSSKTRFEIMHIRKVLALDTPFISESGSAIFWPRATTPEKPRGAKERDGYWVREFGEPYPAIRKHLTDFREAAGVRLEGFGDWNLEAITSLSGVPSSSVALAKRREYSEPFMFRPSPSEAVVQNHLKNITRDGFRVIQGGRFYHLVGESVDKGTAVAELIKWYNANEPAKPKTLAFGDSPSDWPMMGSCDIAVAVKRPDGKYHPSLREHKGIRLAGAPGPEGFNRMILRLLKQML